MDGGHDDEGPTADPDRDESAPRQPWKQGLNKHEPQPGNADLAAPPPFLEEAALTEWRRLGPQLQAMGTLRDVDVPAFAYYCPAWARYLDAERKSGKRATSYGGRRALRW